MVVVGALPLLPSEVDWGAAPAETLLSYTVDDIITYLCHPYCCSGQGWGHWSQWPGGCQRVAVVAASIRLVGGFCRNVVEISGRIFIAVPFLPVVLTLAVW